MRVVFGVVAHRVELDPDLARLSIVGAFHQLDAARFPYVAESLGVAARFELEDTDLGKEIEANVALVTEADRRIHLDQRGRLLPHAHPDRPTFWDFALNLTRLEFDAPGRFRIVLRVDKEVVAEVPLWVAGPAD